MARSFASDSIRAGGLSFPQDPVLSVSLWFKVSSLGVTHVPYSMMINGNDWLAVVVNADNTVRATWKGSGSAELTATSTSGISANTWTHMLGVFNGATSRTIYLSGGNNATESTSQGMGAVPGRHSIGALDDGTTLYSPFTGLIAEVGIWNMVLTAGNAVTLAGGTAPSSVEAANLQAYLTLLTADGITDTEGNTWTNNGSSTDSDHPTMSGGGGSTFVPQVIMVL